MCGGITSMLTSAIDKKVAQKNTLVIAYHFGRILSYSLIGAIVGFTGSLTIKSIGLPVVSLKLVSGLFLILLGLYIGQWFMGLTKVEHIGRTLWRFLSPLSKSLIPVNSHNKSLLLGILWGWLPCGLIYSTLTWSLASGSALNGALIMTAFGLGTLPALLTISFGFLNLKVLLSSKTFRNIVAIILIIYGIYTLFVATNSLI